MYNDYEYLDKESAYTDKDTGVLKNIPKISNADDLLFFESASVARRLKDLESKPIKIKHAVDLLRIHKYLFQDVYDWAGQTRRVEISKGEKQFLFVHSFDNGFAFIDSLLVEYFSIPHKDKNTIARKLAEILDNLNHGHFFREGNGRAQREFVRTLAVQKGYVLNLNPPDNMDIYERYMFGTINGDVGVLEDLIMELLK